MEGKGGERISSGAFPLIKASQLISSPHTEDSLAEINWSPFSCISNSFASYKCCGIINFLFLV